MPNLIRNDYAFGAVTKALDGLSLRSKAITNNVANIDTPGFKSAEVTFEQELQAAVLRPVADDFQMVVTDGAHMPDGALRQDVGLVQAKSQVQDGSAYRNDGNNVDVDREMVRLAETQLQFSAATTFTNLKFAQLRQAIYEGRR